MADVNENDLLDWYVTGERGISSEAMAAVMSGRSPDPKWPRNHPRDPADFRRCVLFLERVEGARENLDKMRAVSDVWGRLVDEWEALEALLYEEMPSGYGYKLYERMKALGC